MKFTRRRELFTQDDSGQWWYQHAGHSRKRSNVRICPWCQEEYLSPDHRQEFCGHKCSAASKHAGKPSTTPRSAKAGAELGNSDNPKFTQDDKGQWWYLAGPSSSRTRAKIRECKCCGKNFLVSIFHKSESCSRSCGLREFNKENPGRWKGRNGSNWKGGKQKLRGYILICEPDHPSIPSGSNRRYVFEHRLVMEKILGRYLEPYETVHHKNGIRHDNRPDNLELWAKRHPGGQRVKDLIEYAEWVLETYGPLKEKLT